MEFEYIIIQAGGKGSRMGFLTRNKPKALIPVNNRPMIFHCLDKFPKKKFIIIGDYKYDVLKNYLSTFASDYSYDLVPASGRKGTCAGIKNALKLIPEGSPFMLIWSDLILSDDFSLNNLPADNYVFLSGDFRCRWKYENGCFSEVPSVSHGVSGCFIFLGKEVLSGIPEDGEFVRWLSMQTLQPSAITLHGTKEYGLLEEYQKLSPPKCRPFNSIEQKGNTITKRGINSQGTELALREVSWYKKVSELGFNETPKIYNYDPLIMEYIQGKNVYEFNSISYEQKRIILDKIISNLERLHKSASCPFDNDSYYEAYISKTFNRIEKVRNLVPFANNEYIIINGKHCRNVFFNRNLIEQLFDDLKPSEFVMIHGDCTFSNIILRNGTFQPVFIDPRGYFGRTEFYGDPAYDWAKLYYSVCGNYDMFNLKRFTLSISENKVELEIESSGWEEMENEFFRLLGSTVSQRHIRLIHAIIWLSLTTYAWDDYDSVCGAFYNGIQLMEDVL